MHRRLRRCGRLGNRGHGATGARSVRQPQNHPDLFTFRSRGSLVRMEPKLLRLIDLEPNDTIRVYCPCGHIVEYRHGTLQRLHRVPSDTLVTDLQYQMQALQLPGRLQDHPL